jgi:3-hydroxymyristoyl/3-hydroxydecanoyl-(acyl carrier protein) dehydratase
MNIAISMGTAERFFPLDHRAADGHFPGNPIIPGAVLLSEVLLAIEAVLNVSLLPCQVKAAKFFYPARPGDRVKIEFTGHGEGEIKFICTVNEKTVLVGQTSL